MAITPIDLQTLFMHMNQVGKEQAQQREGLLMQQTVAGSELVQESEHKDSSVNQTQDVADGPEEIHEDDNPKQGGRRRKHPEKQKGKEDGDSRRYYNDPDLGKNIDITG